MFLSAIATELLSKIAVPGEAEGNFQLPGLCFRLPVPLWFQFWIREVLVFEKSVR